MENVPASEPHPLTPRITLYPVAVGEAFHVRELEELELF
jgi:hypothetical protein